MKIGIRTKGLPNDAVARERVRRRLRFALSRFADRIERVSISLEDVNGPKGGPDKRCRIRLSLSGGGDPLLAEDLDSDIFVAIDRASKRLGRSVSRRLDRGRSLPSERAPSS